MCVNISIVVTAGQTQWRNHKMTWHSHISYRVNVTACKWDSRSVLAAQLLFFLLEFHGNETHTHTHPFNGPMSGTTQVSQYQKGKTNLDLTGARDSEWQWHQLGHMAMKVKLYCNVTIYHLNLSFWQMYNISVTGVLKDFTDISLKM